MSRTMSSSPDRHARAGCSAGNLSSCGGSPRRRPRSAWKLPAMIALFLAAAPGLAAGYALDWSSYLGGSGEDAGWQIAHGPDASIYVVGETFSEDFPLTPDALIQSADSNPNTAEGYLHRFSPDGAELLYGTYLGGGGHDVCRDVAVDGQGNIYVTGITASFDFPVTANAFSDSLAAPGNDAFLLKLNPEGTELLYGTYLGGSDTDKARSVAILTPQIVCITGRTESPDFPVTSGAYDETYNGGWDLFVALLDVDSGELLYSTLIGGALDEEPWDLRLDDGGNAYVSGFTHSPGFPTTSQAYDTSFNGDEDGFLLKLSPDGRQLVFSTFVGGADLDRILRLALAPGDQPVATGFTRSDGFPTTAGAYDETYDGEDDAVVFKLSHDGEQLLFSTFLGGARRDRSQGIVIDGEGDIHVIGRTYSEEFPLAGAPPWSQHSGSADIYVARLDPGGSTLLESVLLGGAGWEAPWGLSLVSPEAAGFVGMTSSDPFPVTQGSYDETHNGGEFDIVAGRFTFELEDASAPEPHGGGITLRAAPNPVRGDVRIAYSLPRPGWIRLELTDAAGRRVAGLRQGPHAAGKYGFTWNGRGDAGELSSGVYFLRLLTAAGSRSERILVLK
ncbi:MAG: hypothetical protein GF355_07405 [Candidatus Eisenbacteria bacterium]|nr:hypothetical protein [Candidatus Eisenbacteria bacterium]